MKILCITPSWKILGGVANHYMGMAPYWKEDIDYLFQGKRIRIPAIFTLLPDYLYYSFCLLFKRPDVVIVNPSLRWYQLIRDSVYIILSLIFHIKVITFIHGWSPDVANKISENRLLRLIFRHTFGNSTFIYVLYSQFKNTLDGWGLCSPVLLTTTKVADDLVEGFDVTIRRGKIENILFLARLEFQKGIMTTLEAFEILKAQHSKLTLSICGTGAASEMARQYVENHKLADVSFCGLVSGKKMIEQFENADIYVLPTTHGEGMATSVLEAMAFGLPVLTTGVGGVNDFFIDGTMGFLLDPNSSTSYIEKIEWLINHPGIVKKNSLYNWQYAKEHFYASEVVKRFENHIRCYVKK